MFDRYEQRAALQQVDIDLLIAEVNRRGLMLTEPPPTPPDDWDRRFAALMRMVHVQKHTAVRYSPEEKRTCLTCQQVKPMAKFDLVGGGYRRRTCSACYSQMRRQQPHRKAYQKQYQSAYRKRT